MTAITIAYGYTALKLAVGLGVFIIILRTTGRGSLTQMTPLDLISNFVMGGIIGGVIYNPDIGVLQLVFVLLIWQGLVLAINSLRKHFPLFQRVIAGGDVALVINGQFQLDEIKRLKIDMSDLATMLRIKGCALHEVAFARFESNGDLSVIKKDEKKRADIVVKNGKVMEDVCKEVGKTPHWIENELKKRGYAVENLFLVEWYQENDDKGKKHSDFFIIPMPDDKTKNK